MQAKREMERTISVTDSQPTADIQVYHLTFEKTRRAFHGRC